MTKRISSAVGVAMLLIGAGCGGSDGDASLPGPVDADVIDADTVDADTFDSDTVSETAIGFGDLLEGSFVLTGAVEDRYEVDDDQLSFVTVGGCQGGVFGIGVNVMDAAATTTYATFGVQGEMDLSGGVTGDFDDVFFETTLIPDGDFALSQRYEGPITMVISEHDTGGVTAELTERRMTVSLSGTVPSDDGDIDVDIGYRWVMGCP